jgi:hypothetical protein
MLRSVPVGHDLSLCVAGSALCLGVLGEDIARSAGQIDNTRDRAQGARPSSSVAVAASVPFAFRDLAARTGAAFFAAGTRRAGSSARSTARSNSCAASGVIFTSSRRLGLLGFMAALWHERGRRVRGPHGANPYNREECQFRERGSSILNTLPRNSAFPSDRPCHPRTNCRRRRRADRAA